MGTTSGSISLDTSRLEERIAETVLQAEYRVMQQLEALRAELGQVRELLQAGQVAAARPAEPASEQVHVRQRRERSAPAVEPSPAAVSSPLAAGPELPVPLGWVSGQTALYRRVRGEAQQRGMAPSQVLRELGWPSVDLAFTFEITVDQLDAVAQAVDPAGWQDARGGAS